MMAHGPGYGRALAALAVAVAVAFPAAAAQRTSAGAMGDRTATADAPPRLASPLMDFAHAHTPAGKVHEPEKGNWVGVVDDGYEALVLRVHLIRAAQRSIDIQTFILQNDECGRLLMYELIQAARRGVRVRLLADHFMSARDPSWTAFLATADPRFELRYYRPAAGAIDASRIELLVHGIVFFTGANQRMHNKVLLVDDALAVVGGRNIDNHYYDHSASYNFIDRDAVAVGPVVRQVRDSFEEYWQDRRSVRAEHLRDVAPLIEDNDFHKPQTREEFAFHGFFGDVDADAADMNYVRARFVDPLVDAQSVRLLADDPGKNSPMVLFGGGKATRRFRKAIRATEARLTIQSPYLILNRSARRMFRKLHRRGVQVDISTNSFAATDNTLAYSANYKLRSVYINRLGFNIYEFRDHPAFLRDELPNYDALAAFARERNEPRDPFLSIHAKTFVRDGELVYIGTHNIDPRSDNLNSEIGFLIEDRRIAQAVDESIRRCMLADSSWVVARRAFPMPLAEANGLVEGISGLSPVDLWPLRNTSSFELRDGAEPVPPGHPDFYRNYRDIGGFPGESGLSMKQITTNIYKVFNTLALPVL